MCLFLFREKKITSSVSFFIKFGLIVTLWWVFFIIITFRSARNWMLYKGHQLANFFFFWCVIKGTVTLHCLLYEVQRAGLHHRIVSKMSTVLIAVDESKYAENAFRCKYLLLTKPQSDLVRNNCSIFSLFISECKGTQ